jgi:hypothetical protein
MQQCNKSKGETANLGQMCEEAQVQNSQFNAGCTRLAVKIPSMKCGDRGITHFTS